MTRRTGVRLAAVGSVAGFAAAAHWRLDAAYGPLRLSADPGDWMVLWELFRHGQIAGRVVLESVAVGTAAAVVPWLVLGLTRRRREPE
jgi:hypothetical protein